MAGLLPGCLAAEWLICSSSQFTNSLRKLIKLIPRWVARESAAASVSLVRTLPSSRLNFRRLLTAVSVCVCVSARALALVFSCLFIIAIKSEVPVLPAGAPGI